jgi:DNA transformation protein
MTESFRRFVLDQLSQTAPQVRGKSMFGGLGIYSGELFFALIASEILYLKVDDETRSTFESLGSKPFKPFADKPMTMSYYDLPLEILEVVSRLQPYVRLAIEAAERARLIRANRTRAKRRR